MTNAPTTDEHAEDVPPRVGPASGDEQHERARGGERDEQPGEPGRAGGGADLRELGGERSEADTGSS